MEANRLLVVDDDPELMNNLVTTLSDAGYVVRSASTCKQALELAAASGFDVALIDMRLPDGLGTGLLIALRALWPHARAILLTGYSSIEAAAAAVSVGAFAYLAKPSTTDDLLQQTARAVREAQRSLTDAASTRRTQSSEHLAAISTMTAGVSHEIRNPLNSASLQLSLLTRGIDALDVSSRTPLLAPLQRVRDELGRLGHVLEDFLLMATPRVPRLGPVDAGALTSRVLDFLAKDAERHQVTVTRHLAEGAIAMADEEQLRQVVMNIALNALEATGPTGVIGAKVWSDAQQVTISFDDSGAGVPTALRERIFEPFFTTKAAGSGLGLSIVRRIVTQLEGRVEVGVSPEGGARLTVTLPRAPATGTSP